MPSPYEAQLRQHAQALITAIRDQLHYDASVDPDSLREYSIAVRLGDAGKAIIYYSPTKKSFKLVPQGLGDHITTVLMSVWEQLPQSSSTGSRGKVPESRTKYQAYVDGSYDLQRKTVGYGAVILNGDQELARLSGRVNKHIESRQIGGELAATMRVIAWCQTNDIAAIDIYYDYAGIEMWATGRWKTEKPVSQEYRQFMKKSRTRVYWHKVKSHTGVKWNEVADQLAREGSLS